MRAIAESCPGHLIKSQQRDDPDLTAEEKEVELTRIFEANPASFLRRFRGHLQREHLAEIRQRRQKRAPEVREAENGENTETVETVLSGCGDYEVEFLIKEIFEEMDDRKKKTKIKNRRYAALKNFREEDFFSHQEMRRRNPLLYSDLVESNLTDEEISARRSKETEDEKRKEEEIRKRDLEERLREKELLKRIEREDEGGDPAEDGTMKEDRLPASESHRLDMQSMTSSLPSTSTGGGGGGGVDNTTLSEYLLKCYDEKETNKFRDFQKGGEEEVEEEEEEEEEEDDDDEEQDEDGTAKSNKKKNQVSECEKSLMEEEFVSRMKEQFLDGGDAIFGVDYQSIDEDERLDDLETIIRDAQDKWFDDDNDDSDNDNDDVDAMPWQQSVTEDEFKPRNRCVVEQNVKMDDEDDVVDYLDFKLDQI